MLDLKKSYRKKRAVSPVVAAILLIGLTVAAGAIVYFIVLPMLSTETGADDVEVTWNENATNTALKVYIKNSGSSDIEIQSVTTNDTTTPITATASPTKIGSGKTVEVTVTLSAAWTITPAAELTFTFEDFSKTLEIAATDWG